jgi:hypothetical protein
MRLKEPAVGSNVVRMARAIPPTATVLRDKAMARA